MVNCCNLSVTSVDTMKVDLCMMSYVISCWLSGVICNISRHYEGRSVYDIISQLMLVNCCNLSVTSVDTMKVDLCMTS